MPGSICKAHQHQGLANKARYAAYFGEDREEQNRARKIARHLKRQPWDGKAFETLRAISVTVLKRAGVTLPDKPAKSPVVIRAEAGTTLAKVRKGK